MKQRYRNFLTLAIAITILLNITMARQTVAETLPTKEEITQMVVRQAKAWEQQNVEAIADDFVEDAVFIAAGFRFAGKQEIKRAAKDYFNQFHNTTVEIKRMIIDGDQGAVEWDWRDRNRQTGNSGFAEDAIIFKLENDKFVYWREYIEKKK